MAGCRGQVESNSKPVSHAAWSALLSKHVDHEGMVDYRGFAADSSALNAYLQQLSAHHPNEKNWSHDERLAYWINAYNAFTIRLIIRHYPVESIKDIAGSIPFVNSPWDIKFIQIEGETYDLNNIEHGIIRDEFDDPRIHFALVCAAKGCPSLRREAYTAEKLDRQLEEETRRFFNDPTKNEIHPQHALLSPLLKWYGRDFKAVAPDILTYINRYSEVHIEEGADIEYGEYDWSLNGK